MSSIMMSIETATTPLKKKIEDVKKLFVAIHKSYEIFSIALEVRYYFTYLNSILCLKESQPKKGDA